MKRIQTLETRDLAKSLKTGGCGECQTSCQSACKTSCGLANQQCENKETMPTAYPFWLEEPLYYFPIWERQTIGRAKSV